MSHDSLYEAGVHEIALTPVFYTSRYIAVARYPLHPLPLAFPDAVELYLDGLEAFADAKIDKIVQIGFT